MKSWKENQTTHFIFSNFFFHQIHAIYMYVILVAFRQQRWLRERASTLPFRVNFLSCNIFV